MGGSRVWSISVCGETFQWEGVESDLYQCVVRPSNGRELSLAISVCGNTFQWEGVESGL